MSRAPSPHGTGGEPSPASDASSASQRAGAGRPVDEQLEPVLAGVAGARHERVDPGDLPRCRGVGPEGGEVDVGERGQHVGGTRALHGDERRLERRIVELGRPTSEPLAQLVRHDRRVARVRDHEERLVTGPVDDEVVDDAPVRRADERVLGAADVEPSRVVRQSGRERRSRVRALDAELAHVREVEESDGRPHRDVLVDDAAVPDRHLPAPERREASARGDVALVQGGPGRRLGHVIGALPSRASSPAGPAGVEMPATGRARARMSRSVG